jgi:radical SAM protein with 4Fe4S-binding SPASM domain
MITPQVGEKLKQANVSMMAVSVYGGSSSAHDSFTGEPGSYDLTMKGIENIKRAGIKFQINTTITKRNISELNAMADLATNLGASAYHVFFLVPTGRGKSLEGDSISAQEYEEVFNRLYDLQMTSELRIKATCAPHYYRVLRQRLAAENKVFPSQQSIFHQITKGCLAGQAVCFISYKGEVYGCGYLDVLAGDLRKENFKDVWQRSELFKTLRDESKLLGKCSVCEFVKICSGCRARAYAKTENYLEEEPDCLYQPIIKTKV